VLADVGLEGFKLGAFQEREQIGDLVEGQGRFG
jgi:hypothetical protein